MYNNIIKNRLATNCDYRTLADKFRVSKSSAIRWTNQVCIPIKLLSYFLVCICIEILVTL